MASFAVEDPVDVLRAQSSVRTIASELGFSRYECQELAIVASELASNILKYGTRGELLVQAVMGERGGGIEIVAIDYGPPFRDLAAAMQDGWDDDGPIDPLVLLTRKGIGGGLGAVVRFTDSFELQESARSKQIVTRRYLSQKPRDRGR